jgi:hypothetical protein
MIDEQSDAAEPPVPSPEEPNKHTRRQRNRKAKAETAPEETASASDVSDYARERRAAIKSRPIYRDVAAGIAIVFEDEIAPGETARRVRLEFDQKPNAEERPIIKREGFIWNGDLEAWTMNATPKARELAKKAVNLLYAHRGIEPAPVVTPSAVRY